MLARLDASSAGDLDQMPFGVVRMTAADGRVVAYNQYESKMSGLSPASVIGRRFFVEVAPCANNSTVAERFEQPVDLDEFVDYVFTFRMLPISVRLRLLKSAAGVFQYLLVLRTDS